MLLVDSVSQSRLGLIGAPRKLNGYAGDVKSDALSSWKLLPTKPNWAKPFEPHWRPGEAGARANRRCA